MTTDASPANRAPRVDRLVAVPILAALLLIWASVGMHVFQQRSVLLAQIRTELSSTVSTLAEFNELAETAGSEIAARATEGRSAVIWRALLQYPAASIWFEKGGVVTAGQTPAGDRANYIEVDDTRNDFSVHVALPRADALTGWRKSLWQDGLLLLAFTAVFLVLTHFLMRARAQRAAAERDADAAAERATQLNHYRTQLENTVAERTADLQQAKGSLEVELAERRAAETALREHDALLNVVTKSAAELLGAQHDDAISLVLELIGQTVAVSRVQLAEISTDSVGHLRSGVRYEWCAPGAVRTIDNPLLQNLDLTAHLPRALGPVMNAGPAAFYITDVSGTYRGLFEQARMRSFLQIPVMVEERIWGSLNFIDASEQQRQWSWAESDTLKTLAGLIGVAIARARYVKELADANMIVQNSPTILYRLKGEPSLPLMYVSHNIVKFGHDPDALIASADWLNVLVDDDDSGKVRTAMARVLDRDAEASSIEFRLRTGDGACRWVENRYTPVRDKDGRLREIEGIIIDITERKAAEEKIALLARTDGLTGLANRSTFVERLRQAFAATGRGAAPFAILYIDLDHFKDVNDTLGHPIGDALLREVSHRLKEATREGDVVARLGGDEFAILQLEMVDPANAGALAEKIVKLVSMPYSIEGNKLSISASIGVCPYTTVSISPDGMLAQADLALYRSKDEGRNQYHFHTDDLDRQVVERVNLTNELRSAMSLGQLELHYQPQVELVSGRITGMEALIRWHHPKRGLLRADSFIPLAEKAGLTATLGNWVLDQACRQMHLWSEQRIAPPVIAVNLSFSQLKNGGDLMRRFQESLARWGVAASSIEFDVTEATLAQLTLMQSDMLQQLRLLGARIAIDDFGTEYSTFDYLRSYQVSQLKIAHSFVSSATSDPTRAATIRAIMNTARELGIGVIAEGVETEEQRRLLSAGGGSASAQGYYFSEPVAADHAEALLRRGNIGPLPTTRARAGTDDAFADQLLAGQTRVS